MAEPSIPDADGPPRIFSAVRVVAAGAAFAAIAVAIAPRAADAPYFPLRGYIGLAPFVAVILLAAIAALARVAVEGRRSRTLLPSRGRVVAFAWAILFFQFACMLALLLLGIAATVLLVARSPLATPVTHGLLVMLLGGTWLAIAGGFVRDVLLLAQRR